MQAERRAGCSEQQTNNRFTRTGQHFLIKKKSKEQHWKLVLHSHLPPSFVMTQRCTLAHRRAVTDWSFSSQKEEKQFWQLVKLAVRESPECWVDKLWPAHSAQWNNTVSYWIRTLRHMKQIPGITFLSEPLGGVLISIEIFIAVHREPMEFNVAVTLWRCLSSNQQCL